MPCGKYWAIALLLSATALGGCQQNSATLNSSNNLNTASTSPVSYEATAELGQKWQQDPKNISNGLAYASALESIGQTNKQLEVYQQLSESYPNDARISALYGKKLIVTGQSSKALPVLERAAGSPNADWRIHLALGTTYDQQGMFEKARSEYGRILTSDPQNLSALNNLGMSFALEGNLKEAEKTLRQANALPRSNAEPRIRQNLALVVGLQGRFDEASKIAQEDLPQDQVEANMAYLQKMLSQPNTWQQLSSGGDAG
jgi:Flp pilus assembly protein TadD